IKLQPLSRLTQLCGGDKRPSMPLLIIQMLFVVLGVVFLTTGKIHLTSRLRTRGVPARLAAALLLLPLPLAQGGGLLLFPVVNAESVREQAEDQSAPMSPALMALAAWNLGCRVVPPLLALTIVALCPRNDHDRKDNRPPQGSPPDPAEDGRSRTPDNASPQPTR